MGREDIIIQERIKKIKDIRASGINPYPNKFERTHLTNEIIEKNSSLKAGSKTQQKVKVAGRVMSIRDFGKIAFAVVQDDSSKIQINIQKDETPEKTRTLFTKFIDVGDFIGVEGTVIRTERGELSVLAKGITLLQNLYYLYQKNGTA